MKLVLLQGDCFLRMQSVPDASVDVVICDPPYGLEFAGQDWDKLQPHHAPAGKKGGKEIKAKSKKPRHEGDKWVRLSGGYGAPKKNPRCRKCRHLHFAPIRSKCQCDEPDWDLRQYEYAQQMQQWHVGWLEETHRVLRIDGKILAFGGTRTFHRLAQAMEDVGFTRIKLEAWSYATGFPKSMDVSVAIDKIAGVERPVIGPKQYAGGLYTATQLDPGGNAAGVAWQRPWRDDPEKVARMNMATAPATEAAWQWSGWGTALKPCWEPIVIGVKS